MSETIDPISKSRSVSRSIYNGVVVAAAGGSLVFEQSPANEALRVNAGLDVLQSTGSAPAVGLTIFGITAAIEGISSGLISAGLHAEGGAVQRLKARLQKSDAESDKSSQEKDSKKKTTILGRIANTGADVGIALGLGAGLVTVKRHVADPNPTLSKDLKNSAKATGIVSTVSGTIGYLAGGGIANAEKVGLETPAQYVIDYGTDTRFWMGALAIGYGGYFAKKGIDKFKKRSGNGDDEGDTDIAGDLQSPSYRLVTE